MLEKGPRFLRTSGPWSILLIDAYRSLKGGPYSLKRQTRRVKFGGTKMNRNEAVDKIAKVQENMQSVIIGKEDVIQRMMICMIAGGHVLLEDVPGTGKTMIAKSMAKSMDLTFQRIQFTPDLLPADITGLNIYNRAKEEFQFVPGPVMTNVLLADEINRATPRTQSALLEAMQEEQVTVDGVSRKLDVPFFVIATQNPVETAGTFQAWRKR